MVVHDYKLIVGIREFEEIVGDLVPRLGDIKRLHRTMILYSTVFALSSEC